MHVRRFFLSFFCALAIVTAVSVHYSPVILAADRFQPPSPEELKITSEPLAPGAPAVILFRQVDRDDFLRRETTYVRIKILKEEGRRFADVEAPFFKEGGADIVNIKARTVRPDGTAIDFAGKAYEKTIAKAKGLKYMAKVFTLPDVQAGSIIEYSYTRELDIRFVVRSRWILNDGLFTKHASFSLRPAPTLAVRWTWQGLPDGATPPKAGKDKIIRLELDNVPAFQAEDYMPPEGELRAYVDFIYGFAFENEPEKFWTQTGKRLNDQIEAFIGKKKVMEAAVAQIVSPNDAAEVKLRKIYERVQELRNTSSEMSKSEQERKREKDKPIANVEEAWKKGQGDAFTLTWLFLALVRAAGLEAYPVFASNRSNAFFVPKSMDLTKLTETIVLVKVNGKDLYYDPGWAYTPFGLLYWAETGVPALRLDTTGGTWIETPRPESSSSRVERRATLTLKENGELEGKLSLTFTGLEAMERRREVRNEDEAARKKSLEDEAKEYIPTASEIELTNKPDWSSSSTPLVAEFNIKIREWASRAGRRALVPVGIFSAAEKHVFDHAERVHPIYIHFPHENIDDINLILPADWAVTGQLPEQEHGNNLVFYKIKVEKDKEGLHFSRMLRFNFILLETSSYPALRDLFQSVRKSDEQQIVLEPGGKIAGQ